MHINFSRYFARAGFCAIAVMSASLCIAPVASAQQQQPPQADMGMDAGTRAAIIEAVIHNLQNSYVFPAVAASIEKDIRARSAAGAFDALTSANAFASAMTALLREDSHGDRHLEVLYFAQEVPEDRPGKQDAHGGESDAADARRHNFGFASVARLPGNIGYIDLHEFTPSVDKSGRMASAMNLVGDTKALIVDLRKCGGGDTDAVKFVSSYFYGKPTHLNDIYFRDEDRTEVRWTLAQVPGQRYAQDKQVYLLTGKDTFSGCEDFAYTLKNNGRAILVGESTGGGAHPGSPHRLSSHFMMFVPSGRPISPVTHTDWEGTGVAPDVVTTADASLDVAQATIVQKLAAQEQDASIKHGLLQRLAELQQGH
jgi:hypothetical protein